MKKKKLADLQNPEFNKFRKAFFITLILWVVIMITVAFYNPLLFIYSGFVSSFMYLCSEFWIVAFDSKYDDTMPGTCRGLFCLCLTLTSSLLAMATELWFIWPCLLLAYLAYSISYYYHKSRLQSTKEL